jgi:hypothetical protein
MATVSNMIDLNDSDILALEQGPLRRLQECEEKMMDLESFRLMAIEAFGEAGFQVTVKCFDTTQQGVYAFDIEINGRVPGSRRFDPDRQVHEVVNNILKLPDQEGGFIKTDRKMFEDLASGNVTGGKHDHHH